MSWCRRRSRRFWISKSQRHRGGTRERLEDRGAGRRDHLGLAVADPHREAGRATRPWPAAESESGHAAVRAKPLPIGSGDTSISSMPSRCETPRRRHDVHDRVDRADLVKVDLFGAGVMDFRFGLGQHAEDRDRVALDRRRPARLRSMIARISRQMALGLRPDHLNVELGRRDSADDFAAAPAQLAYRAAPASASARLKSAKSTPRSRSAPAIMSPLSPENASR